SLAVVRNLWIFVQPGPDTVSYKLAYYAEAVGFHQLLYGGSHIANRIADSRRFNSVRERLAGYIQQLLQLGLDLIAHRNRYRRIPVVAVQNHAAIDGDDIAGFQHPLFRRD